MGRGQVAVWGGDWEVLMLGLWGCAGEGHLTTSLHKHTCQTVLAGPLVWFRLFPFFFFFVKSQQ